MFAMAFSFLLSRTLVPTMALYMLRVPMRRIPDLHGNNTALPPSRNPLVRFQRGFEERFERVRDGYRSWLEVGALHHRIVFVVGFMAFVLASFALVPFLGQNFFPAVDSAGRS
jgi:multidrug efflux pump subunit AcrB